MTKKIVTSRHKKGSALEIDETGRVYDPADPKEWEKPSEEEMRERLAKWRH